MRILCYALSDSGQHMDTLLMMQFLTSCQEITRKEISPPGFESGVNEFSEDECLLTANLFHSRE